MIVCQVHEILCHMHMIFSNIHEILCRRRAHIIFSNKYLRVLNSLDHPDLSSLGSISRLYEIEIRDGVCMIETSVLNYKYTIVHKFLMEFLI